jgi:hypothetical protein
MLLTACLCGLQPPWCAAPAPGTLGLAPETVQQQLRAEYACQAPYSQGPSFCCRVGPGAWVLAGGARVWCHSTAGPARCCCCCCCCVPDSCAQACCACWQRCRRAGRAPACQALCSMVAGLCACWPLLLCGVCVPRLFLVLVPSCAGRGTAGAVWRCPPLLHPAASWQQLLLPLVSSCVCANGVCVSVCVLCVSSCLYHHLVPPVLLSWVSDRKARHSKRMWCAHMRSCALFSPLSPLPPPLVCVSGPCWCFQGSW